MDTKFGVPRPAPSARLGGAWFSSVDDVMPWIARGGRLEPLMILVVAPGEHLADRARLDVPLISACQLRGFEDGLDDQIVLFQQLMRTVVVRALYPFRKSKTLAGETSP